MNAHPTSDRPVAAPVLPAAGSPPPGAGARDALERERTIDTLARTLWGEARGEPVRGIEAVAAVILNRVRVAEQQGRYWWGNTVREVCRKPYQFSCWNRNDPNLPQLLAVRAGDRLFDSCLRIARRAIAGLLDDPTDGATHYHTRGVHPQWAAGATPTAEIGRHVFYRLNTAPPKNLPEGPGFSSRAVRSDPPSRRSEPE